MARSDRPGGLTALAVINFIYASSVFISVPKLLFRRFMNFNGANVPAGLREDLSAFQALPWGEFGVLVGLEVAVTALLVIAGLGYMMRKRWIGRWGGNLYAIAGMISVGLALCWLPASLGGNFTLSSIVSLFYPLFTLYLVNSTFRPDLCR